LSRKGKAGSVLGVAALLPALAEGVHETRAARRLTDLAGDGESPWRGESEHRADEHHSETEKPDEGLLHDDSHDEEHDSGNGTDDGEGDRGVAGTTATAHLGDVVGVVVVEVALHLIEEALLLLRKWHGGLLDREEFIVGRSCVDKVGACLRVRD
jgi:hypothetical protein